MQNFISLSIRMSRQALRYAAGFLAALVLLAGCDAAEPVVSSESEEATTPDGEPLLTYDDELAEIAREIDGFGGFFVDEQGALSAYVAGASKDAASTQAALASAAEQFYGADVVAESASKSGEAVRVVPGEYGFLQLYQWKEDARPALDVPGAIFVDIDDQTNRLRVGVEDAGARSAVEAALRSAGVPPEAVEIEETEPVAFSATVRDRLRPPVGGMQISFRSGNGAFLCTYGFNARGPNGTLFFVINSHCTASQGGNQNTAIFQPSIASGNQVGVEARDPGYYTGGNCPSGRRCRYSDAALIRRTVFGDFGKIIRTQGLNSGSLQRKGTFQITQVSSNIAPGSAVAKVGRTTGWTNGRVESTCVTTNVTGTNITLLCQNFTSYASAGGDSGSPVFNDLGNGNARLRGIHWGGNSTSAVYSPIGQIQAELGSNLRFK